MYATVCSICHRTRYQARVSGNPCQHHQYLVPAQCSPCHWDRLGFAAQQGWHVPILICLQSVSVHLADPTIQYAFHMFSIKLRVRKFTRWRFLKCSKLWWPSWRRIWTKIASLFTCLKHLKSCENIISYLAGLRLVAHKLPIDQARCDQNKGWACFSREVFGFPLLWSIVVNHNLSMPPKWPRNKPGERKRKRRPTEERL